MTRSNSRWLVLLAIAAMARSASADTAPGTVESAKALYVEGKQLREEGDLKKSLEKLEAAHALYATPITALEAGRAYALVGQLTKAVDVLGTVERLPPQPNESKKARDARIEAKALLGQYLARLGRLVILVKDRDTRVFVDGAPIPSESFGAPPADGGPLRASWAVDPGPHVVSADRGLEKATEDVRVAEGEVRTVTLRFTSPQPPAPAPAAPAVAPVEKPASPPPEHIPVGPVGGERSTPMISYVGFGLGAAGAIVGTVTGIMTLSRASSLKNECSPSGECLPSAGLGEARTLGIVSTASFIAAGAGVTIGLAGLFFGARDAPQRAGVWVAPTVGGAGAGVAGGVAWE